MMVPPRWYWCEKGHKNFIWTDIKCAEVGCGAEILMPQKKQ